MNLEGISEEGAEASYQRFARSMVGFQARRGMSVDESKRFVWNDICEGHQRHIPVWRSRGNESEARKLELELVGALKYGKLQNWEVGGSLTVAVVSSAVARSGSPNL
jgi:hypothetical protein